MWIAAFKTDEGIGFIPSIGPEDDLVRGVELHFPDADAAVLRIAEAFREGLSFDDDQGRGVFIPASRLRAGWVYEKADAKDSEA